ncbi:ProQ/FINO family protein [Mesorhizobium xinjiangense]|uniref:ProQ/FINO family protein n=1 Tax=Mesorhizobium xinjiangense TaxID=2678685 RepID=UPI0038B3D3B6
MCRALRAYTRTDQYLKALCAGGARIDLDGNQSGEVSDAEAVAAKALRRTRKARSEARQTPQPTGQPEPLSAPEPKKVLAFKAKRTDDRSQDVVVVTKRRRSFRKPVA